MSECAAKLAERMADMVADGDEYTEATMEAIEMDPAARIAQDMWMQLEGEMPPQMTRAWKRAEEIYYEQIWRPAQAEALESVVRHFCARLGYNASVIISRR